MGLFNFLRKKEPVRAFSSDAGDFSPEQIWKAMKEFYADGNVLPASKPDDYVKGLIESMVVLPDFTLKHEVHEGDVNEYLLSIARNGSFDNVWVQYMGFNPNVVYITTAPYGFAGDRDSFIGYCNGFQDRFPMISIGCKNVKRELKLPKAEVGTLTEGWYAVRTCVPLLGTEKDFSNLVVATRCLPIYGYDLRDGYHSNNPQPYPSGVSGLNIQLDKVVNIHHFKGVKGYVPAEAALYGDSQSGKVPIDSPAYLSNPFVRYLNYMKPPHTMRDIGEMYIHYPRHIRKGDNVMESVFKIRLICYQNYPGLYTVEYDKEMSKEDAFKVDKLLEEKEQVDLPDVSMCIKPVGEEVPEIPIFERLSEFNFPEFDSDAHDMAIYKATVYKHETDEDLLKVTYAMTQCLPNGIDSNVLAMQIADFFRRIGEPMDFFAPGKKD